MQNNNSEFILFKTEDEKISVDVRMNDDTVWLTQDQMVILFDKAKSTISEHIKHIFEEHELDENSVVRKFRTTASDGKNYEVNYYNLDVVISVGYRVKSLRGTQFRQWATKRLNEYIRKGFTMDDERLKNLGGGSYWKELLQRIRDIRASEKVFYRQVLDIYATSTENYFEDLMEKELPLSCDRIEFKQTCDRAYDLVYEYASKGCKWAA